MSTEEEGAFTLTLAGKEIRFRPLTLRQFRRIVPQMVGLQSLAKGGDLSEADVDKMIGILVVAGEKAETPFDADWLLDQSIGTAELLTALTVIAGRAGLAAKQDDGSEAAASPL